VDVAPEDRQMVARARDGDADAFEELVRLHSGPVFRMLTRVIGDPTAAEDAAQEAFVRAWRALPTFRAEAKFSTWLYRIAMNEAYRLLAREQRQPTLPFDDVLHQVPDLSADPLASVQHAELEARLEQAIAQLPAQYRVCVVLRDIESLTNEEAAEVLGLNLRNFKSRLHRGRMAVRKLLEDFYEER
jgi:RNA polymerase sigma-70 factor (ECF subfamily)